MQDFWQEDSNFARIHSLRSKFVLRSTTAFCRAKTPNVAPSAALRLAGSHHRTTTKQKNTKPIGLVFFCLAGAGGFEPATHGFGVALIVRTPLKILDFSAVSTHFSRKTICRGYVWKTLMLYWCCVKISPFFIAYGVILMLFNTQNLRRSNQRNGILYFQAIRLKEKLLNTNDEILSIL